MCQTALTECNIFNALNTIHQLLLSYETSGAQFNQTNLQPQETWNHGKTCNSTVPYLTNSLHILSKAEVPRIKDEFSESVLSSQPNNSRGMGLLDSVKTDKTVGYIADMNIQGEFNRPQFNTVPDNKGLPQHEGNGNGCVSEIGTENNSIDTLQRKNKATKRKHTKKATRKRPNIEGKVAMEAKEAQFSCTICKKLYIRKKHLDRHFKLVHDGQEAGEFPCNNCQTLFDRQSKLDQHMQQVHVPQACSVCNEIFTGTVHLNKHMKHHQEKPDGDKSLPLVCNQCGKTCSSQYRLEEHLNKEHGHVDPGLYACEICKTTFHRETSLKKHMEQHISGFVCQICSQKFTDAASLKRHRVKHWKRYCKLCPAQFSFSTIEFEVIKKAFI